MYLKNFDSIQPPYQKQQSESLEWLAAIYKAAQTDPSKSKEHYRRLLQKVACSEEHIQQRHFFIPDPHCKNLEAQAIYPVTSDAMELMLSDWGMKMTLSKDVPGLVAKMISRFTRDWLKSIDTDVDRILKDAIFAVHPGGPKIIDQVTEQLNLRKDQVEASLEILRDRVNMSSATLPHLWERLLMRDKVASVTPIVSFAFGPGLTICGSLMEKL